MPELCQVRLPLDYRHDVRGVCLCLFAIVPRFSRTADIVITVVERKCLEHHEGMRPGHAHLRSVRGAIRQPSFQRTLLRLAERDCTPGARASMNPLLHIHTKIGRTLEFLGSHELNPHLFMLSGIAFSN